jgi:hypothetical protein
MMNSNYYYFLRSGDCFVLLMCLHIRKLYVALISNILSFYIEGNICLFMFTIFYFSSVNLYRTLFNAFFKQT